MPYPGDAVPGSPPRVASLHTRWAAHLSPHNRAVENHRPFIWSSPPRRKSGLRPRLPYSFARGPSSPRDGRPGPRRPRAKALRGALALSYTHRPRLGLKHGLKPSDKVFWGIVLFFLPLSPGGGGQRAHCFGVGLAAAHLFLAEIFGF